MVNFSKKELQYIIDQFEFAISNVSKLHDAKLKEYIDNIGGNESISNALILFQLEDISVVNTDELLNKTCVQTIYDICGYFVWVECWLRTKEEVAEYVPEKEYCSIYEKIINEDLKS